MKIYLRNWEFPHELVIYERRVAAMRRLLDGKKTMHSIIFEGRWSNNPNYSSVAYSWGVGRNLTSRDTLDIAMKACDKQLIRRGYVLLTEEQTKQFETLI